MVNFMSLSFHWLWGEKKAANVATSWAFIICGDRSLLFTTAENVAPMQSPFIAYLANKLLDQWRKAQQEQLSISANSNDLVHKVLDLKST